MQDFSNVTHQPTVFQALDSVLRKSASYVVPEKRQDFEKQVLNLELALIDRLGRQASTYCNGGWEEIKADWLELLNRYQTLQERQQLLKPADWSEFDAAIRWMAGRGMEEELDLLEQVRKSPPRSLTEDPATESHEEICRLIQSAEQRIRKRINDPEYVMIRGEAAYSRNEEAWSAQYSGEFIAIYRGDVVAHDSEQAQLAKKLFDLQEEKGRFRAYVVEVGSPIAIARGPHGGAHRPVNMKD
jgi:hypothetical protein